MPDNPLLTLSRQQLAQLGREYMIAAQINSRVGYAKIRIDHGDDAYLPVAVSNWIAASPVYTRRMQQAMGFADHNTVKEIFKGLQLECGFTHQYFDHNFVLDAPDQGRFWLNSCGALSETEPRGDKAVEIMCHHIEDPTFDATATATNPRARMRPIHRPPRAPGSQGPVCSWNVFIDESADPLPTPEITKFLAQSLLANVALDILPESSEQGGLDDYSGELFEKISLEVFSQKALATISQELALQNNLLIRSLLMVVTDAFGESAALAVCEFQMTGSGRLVSERLSQLFGCQTGGVDAIARILPLHPAFQPLTYSQLAVEVINEHSVALEIGPGPALQETDQFSWIKLICSGRDAGLESLLRGIDPSAVCTRDEASPHRWIVTIDGNIPTEDSESLPVQIGRGAIISGLKVTSAPEIIRFIN